MISASVYLSCFCCGSLNTMRNTSLRIRNGSRFKPSAWSFKQSKLAYGTERRRTPPARTTRTGTAASSIALLTAFTDKPVTQEASATVHSGNVATDRLYEAYHVAHMG